MSVDEAYNYACVTVFLMQLVANYIFLYARRKQSSTKSLMTQVKLRSYSDRTDVYTLVRNYHQTNPAACNKSISHASRHIMLT